MPGKRPAPGKFKVRELRWTWRTEETSVNYPAEDKTKVTLIKDENSMNIANLMSTIYDHTDLLVNHEISFHIIHGNRNAD